MCAMPIVYRASKVQWWLRIADSNEMRQKTVTNERKDSWCGTYCSSVYQYCANVGLNCTYVRLILRQCGTKLHICETNIAPMFDQYCVSRIQNIA